MGWTLLNEAARPVAGEKSPVCISANMGLRGCHPQVLLMVRPALLDGLAGWWKPKARVQVELGTGEHDGQLRITPGTRLVLGKTPGKNGQGSVVLRLRSLPFWTPAKRKPEPVEHEWNDGWLVVTLPDWARRPAATPAGAEAVAAPAKRPFRIGEGTEFAGKHVANGGLVGRAALRGSAP